VYAVIGLWTMDPAMQDLQDQELNDRIVTSVANTRGFVRGAWAREVDGDRSVSFIEFDDESAARDFVNTVHANAPRQRAAGVSTDELLLVELVAESQR
jgi:peroxiredoxin